MSITVASATMRQRYILFLLFFCSGFSGLVYQVVWLRLAFAHFGIITPVLSVVISVFMLGLGIGSLLAGRYADRMAARTGLSPASLYGLAELVIGIGAVAVPVLFGFGEQILLGAGHASSTQYLFLSALLITGAILPWCVAMGATYPLMMAYVRAQGREEKDSFSYLYLANVVGAMCGTLASALVLIELLGFTRTSLVAAVVNVGIAIVSFLLPRAQSGAIADAPPRTAAASAGPRVESRWVMAVLFTTGFCSLAMEVIWTRAFTIILSTTIYAFAGILTTYLLATWMGSALYRASLRRGGGGVADRVLLLLACGAALLPVVLIDPRVQFVVYSVIPGPNHVIAALLALGSIMPICLIFGFLTPKLIDDYAEGEPRLAGRCYAVNILGSILGPLVAGYALMPVLDVQYALILLALPLACLVLAWATDEERRIVARRRAFVLSTILLAFAALRSFGYDTLTVRDQPNRLLRDHVATVIAYGKGVDRGLLVNGVGITNLTPLTKVMAHLPAAVHGKAQNGLVICFGMGTTLRSLATWGIESTSVDLVPSVPETFDFFHDDAARILANPKVHIVVDDGRRFLARTEQLFDLIVIDPPPPPEAGGSSLLYSTGFYDAAKRRLREGGILQQWIPGAAEPAIIAAVAQTLRASFPHVQAFHSVEGWGYHFLASMQPLPELDADTLLARMPDAAQRDLVEWGPKDTPRALLEEVLAGRRKLESLPGMAAGGPVITDDRPFNEYYLLRRRVTRRN